MIVKIKSELEKYYIMILDLLLKIGLVVEIKGVKLGKMVMLCLDIDVLFILEELGVFFSFEWEGVMYVCGYDFYFLVVLGVVILFK